MSNERKNQPEREIMKISLDRTADAGYIKVSNNKITKTICASEYCNIDLAEDGSIVGIELLSIRRQSKKKIRKELNKLYDLNLAPYWGYYEEMLKIKPSIRDPIYKMK